MHPAKLRCLLDAPPSTPTTASKFRVLYDDNSKDAVHSLSETAVCIQQDAGTDDEYELPPGFGLEEIEMVVAQVGDWTKKELQDYCKEHGLQLAGNKYELFHRVTDYMLDHAQEQAHAAGGEALDENGRAHGITTGGQHLRIAGGQPAYSMPRAGGPRKRALIIGCSYKWHHGADRRPDRPLPPAYSAQHPQGVEWLMQDLQPGDSLFFYFSGHGGQEREKTGEEPRGYNQTICPIDYKLQGQIKDSRIHQMLVHPLPMGVTLHALIDACYSGTVMNLPYNALLKKGYFSGWEEEYKGQSWKQATAGGLAVQFSAARHDQFAKEMDHQKNGKTARNGAATYAFVQAIQRHRGVWGFEILYAELLQAMYDELQQSRFNHQEPTLSSSTALNLVSSRTKLRL
ncbi:hypothetical protein COHA_004309 [Chlorella ohadii]|uniref:SAP domain-containing protein n=1 Tax=Chlorella ohadii TaxID=2649997 RepID=A0AAD5DTR3_9CHLO|nr:hypothetical protein COHA_004309 [Chlorella ohadii]